MRSPWRSLHDRWRDYWRKRVQDWALRRQGSDPPQLTLASGRIYILPTVPGLLYAAMLATMLAGAMNYNNNLGFALTFLLAGAGVASIYHTHRILVGLRIHYRGAEPVFAGDPLQVRFSLVNDSAEAREEIYLDWTGSAAVPGGLPARQSRSLCLPLATSRRGSLPLPRLRLSTRAPLGLMRAWAWVHLDARPLVYPRPGSRVPAGQATDASLRDRGDEEFAGLRAYQPGDSPRRVAWRHYARSDELLVQDYRGGSTEDCRWLDWERVAGDADTRASRLARLVIDACEADTAWGLRLPGTRLGPARGRDHLHRCLAALATVESPGDPQR
ncbi:MAG: DUF58 domain-containing protein [Gammaproteobacteria bacterium]|nr:DUF58 domain-containing protein [Gammaproteobacteria bacterium]